ncbi:unnamed protein product [Rhizophagus irregularis]|uniref:Uncharacterized protein n=1 Tax=Rhizophagus irregularis TaxID=588596 RepID=A0A915ZMP6_9GLOM|nr:unnamed protein product [Rhizophagus irregularis]
MNGETCNMHDTERITISSFSSTYFGYDTKFYDLSITLLRAPKLCCFYRLSLEALGFRLWNKNAKKSKSPSFSPVPTLSPAIPTPTLATPTPTPASPITTTTAIKFKPRKSSLNNIISSKHSSRGLTYPSDNSSRNCISIKYCCYQRTWCTS